MKKIMLGMAVALVFSAMAQETDKSVGNKNWKKKEFGERPFEDQENLEKLNMTDVQKAQIGGVINAI